MGVLDVTGVKPSSKSTGKYVGMKLSNEDVADLCGGIGADPNRGGSEIFKDLVIWARDNGAKFAAPKPAADGQ